ncbi:MAG: tRNA (adenosine(37)-N6)-threonylcarbamoyltransferase complex dimerization subunit type 1 TsaB [Betaproteobacteria bacterium]|nr:tRNA (adenosine(37)-N6)-threonylcarbamoyltransferase complex dimerization subunit type 1 TsaB [Betaproteobacteria bacterium]
MRIFALETSTERLSLALIRDGTPFERDVQAGQQHSDLALPLIRALFDEAGMAIRDLDAIAFGQGPGSFTGVRIACGLAQGMAFGAGLGLLPVPTQMTIAEQCEAERVLVALDARMGEIYLAAYVRDGLEATGWRTQIAPMLARPSTLPALEPGTWTLTGSATAVPALRDALAVAYGPQLAAVEAGRMPRALPAAHIAGRTLNHSGPAALVNPRDAAPLYVRDHVALTTAEREARKPMRKDGARGAEPASKAAA